MGEEDLERAMLELIRRKDPAGFDLMVDRYAPPLYRYALRMCGESAEAEDVLQETFLLAQEKIAQFRGEGPLHNWLYKIATNACRQRQRRRQRQKSRELRLEDVIDTLERVPAAWEADPGQRMLSAELAGKLEAAMARVPGTNRSVLLLRDVQGLSTRETAQVLGITEQTVKVRLHRARAFVRNLLNDYFEGKE